MQQKTRKEKIMIRQALKETGRYDNVTGILDRIRKNQKKEQKLRTEADKLIRAIRLDDDQKISLPELIKHTDIQINKKMSQENITKEKEEQITHWKVLELIIWTYHHAKDKISKINIPAGWCKNNKTNDILHLDQTVYIKGNIVSSYITKLIEGDVLRRDQINRLNRGWMPIEKPYTSITIKNARIKPTVPTGRLTPEEYFIENYKFFTSREYGTCYLINNKAPEIPNVFILDKNDPTKKLQVELQAELEKELEVTLVLHTCKLNMHVDFLLDHIIINNPEKLKRCKIIIE